MAEFSWAAAADVGLGLLGSYYQGRSAKAVAAANNEIRAASNSVARSSAMLATKIQEINNRRILRSAGKNLDTMFKAASDQQDVFARQGFEASVQQAEVLGQVGAAAAAAGVGGSSVQAMSSVAGMAAARTREYLQRDQANATYKQLEAMTGVMGDAVASLDNSAIVPQQDYTRDRAGSMTSYLISGLFSKRNSLQTLLGSLNSNEYTYRDSALQGPPDLAQTYPVNQSNVTGSPLAQFAWTSPVWQSNLVPRNLPSITLK